MTVDEVEWNMTRNNLAPSFTIHSSLCIGIIMAGESPSTAWVLLIHCSDGKAHARNITAHSTALIAQDCDIRGTVSFGPGCVIHPRATIHVLSPNGAIKFGKDCVVEEGAKIIHSYIT
jgi:UDP-3-O-[3-hydroxymyristoyl] glucosamine N-acyltransferase